MSESYKSSRDVALVDLYNYNQRFILTYELLAQRTPEQSISHVSLPSWEEHCRFVNSKPYVSWDVIMTPYGEAIGTIYLTDRNEVGIFLLQKRARSGYGTSALKALEERHPDKRLWANVSIKNYPSAMFFIKEGYEIASLTLKKEPRS